MENVKQLVTIHGVSVDSVCETIWNANKGGIKDLIATPLGVRIEWNLGCTFVPWSNVRYVKEF